MIIGVLAFSFASGALTSLLMDMDFKNMKFNLRIKTLEIIRKKFNISKKLYLETRQTIKNNFKYD